MEELRKAAEAAEEDIRKECAISGKSFIAFSPKMDEVCNNLVLRHYRKVNSYMLSSWAR